MLSRPLRTRRDHGQRPTHSGPQQVLPAGSPSRRSLRRWAASGQSSRASRNPSEPLGRRGFRLGNRLPSSSIGTVVFGTEQNKGVQICTSHTPCPLDERVAVLRRTAAYHRAMGRRRTPGGASRRVSLESDLRQQCLALPGDLGVGLDEVGRGVNVVVGAQRLRGPCSGTGRAAPRRYRCPASSIVGCWRRRSGGGSRGYADIGISTIFGTPTRRVRSRPVSARRSSVIESGTPTSGSSCRPTHTSLVTTTATRRSRPPRSSSGTAGTHAKMALPRMVRLSNVPKSVPIGHENDPRGRTLGSFPLVAGTGFEPATSGL
jgi:hypothetical protein